jgi:hypothetical protein
MTGKGATYSAIKVQAAYLGTLPSNPTIEGCAVPTALFSSVKPTPHASARATTTAYRGPAGKLGQ